jgi:hypothetical protein
VEVAFKTVKISLFVSAQPDVAGAEAGGVFGSTVIGMEPGGGIDDADEVEPVFINLRITCDHENVAGAFAFDDLKAFPSQDVTREEVADFGDFPPRAAIVFVLTILDESFIVIGRERADSIWESGSIHIEISFGEMTAKNVADEP